MVFEVTARQLTDTIAAACIVAGGQSSEREHSCIEPEHVGFPSMESVMQRKRDKDKRWLSGLLVTLTTIVAYLAFWRLSPLVTFIVGCVALVLMLIAAWEYGRRINRSREK